MHNNNEKNNNLNTIITIHLNKILLPNNYGHQKNTKPAKQQ